MLLLIPLGTEAALKSPPKVTISIIVACTLVALLTQSPEDLRTEMDLAKLERVAAWTLQKEAARSGQIASSPLRHGSALEYLAKDGRWRDAVTDPVAQERLESCLREYRSVVDQHPYYRYGFIPADVTLVRLVTHQFLHLDFLHIFFNMLFLWAVGPVLEATWGPLLFGPVYLLLGFAAALAHALGNPGSTEPAIGASGAVAGLMGAFAVTHARLKIPLIFVASIGLLPRVRFVAAPAWLFLGFWAAEQVFYTVLTAEMNVGVAFLAHLGGFGAGMAAAVPLRWLRPPAAVED